MISLYFRGGHTIGDTLMGMCLFNTLSQPVNLITWPESLYVTWKRILDVGDRVNLQIEEINGQWANPPHPLYLESMKLFSRYDQFDHVQLFNQSFPIGKSNKKCVGIFIHNGDYIKDDEFFNRLDTIQPDEYPFYKFHGRRVYNHIIDIVQSAGYDPLIIDSKDISLENKVFLLNELCDFVIGYEGGMCHVAHTLRIPTIILPLRLLHVITEKKVFYHTDFLHLDRRTYFVRNIDELFSWDSKKLLELVDVLRNEGGNNQWLYTNDPAEFIEHYRTGSDKTFNNRLDWVLQNMTNPTLGGY
jgi:hypothetical protein